MAIPPPSPPGPSPTPPCDDSRAHNPNMHGTIDTTIPSQSTRDKVVRISAELFGVAETAELLSFAASLATKADLAALRIEFKSDLAALESRLTSAMRNQAVALIGTTTALQLATIGVVASLVA